MTQIPMIYHLYIKNYSPFSL